MTADIYYALRPLIPRWAQIMLRRGFVQHRHRQHHDRWPILKSSATTPPGWSHWPDGKRFAIVLTHDVEGPYGVSRCRQLADIEAQRGLRSAFAFVPERYHTPPELRQSLQSRGFEIIVHDFNHDGKLYRDRDTFEPRRDAIIDCLKRWNTGGFASGASLHNLKWISELNVDYDISTYDTDPFEPQSCGFGRIFPYWIQSPNGKGRGYVELPYTLPQDFTLFILLREQSNAIWRQKLDWIAEHGGMALLKTHPDYIAFHDADKRLDRYPVSFYSDFLDYALTRYGDVAWFAQPSEVAQFWRGLRGSSESNVIAPQPMFCPTCRDAHAGGWLNNYQPSQESGLQPDAICLSR